MFVWDVNEEKVVRTKFSIILFVCSLLVICIHTYNLEAYGIDESSIGLSRAVFCIETYWSIITGFAVPLFFLISGILFFRTFDISLLLTKWKNRLFTIVIPYLIWCTLYYIYYVLCTNIPMISSLMNSKYKVNFSIYEWISSLWINKYYTLWFLQNLIVFIILTPAIWILLKNHFKKLPTGLMVLIILLVAKSKISLNIAYLSGIDLYLIGSYIGINCREFLFKKNKIISIISLIYIIFVLVTSFSYLNLMTEILLYLSIWYSLDLIELKRISIPWWMSITFFTYVAHDALLEAMEKIFLVVCGTKPIFALIDYIMMPLAVETILILIAYFIRKKMPTVWKVLTGGR